MRLGTTFGTTVYALVAAVLFASWIPGVMSFVVSRTTHDNNNNNYCNYYYGRRRCRWTATTGETTEYSDFDLPTSNDSMTPEEIVRVCMMYLQENENTNDGLEICYNFSSDSCRMANGGSLESFFLKANNPVFQTMVACDRWEVLNVGNEIPGTPTRGAMTTVLVRVVPRDKHMGERQQRTDRTFLWTLMKERRPPRQGHFLVHECIAVDNAFAHTE